MRRCAAVLLWMSIVVVLGCSQPATSPAPPPATSPAQQPAAPVPADAAGQASAPTEPVPTEQAPLACPDPDDPHVRYQSQDQSVCARIRFACEPGEILFGNECGCGCVVPRPRNK